MKPLAGYLIKCETRYNNKVNVEGRELIVNTDISEKDHIFVNRIGKVLETPKLFDTTIESGDDVIIHHNVFRRWYNVRGEEKNTASFYKDDKYIVDQDLIYAYRRDDNWYPLDGYVFVKPVEQFIIPDGFRGDYNHFEPLLGEIVIGDKTTPQGALIGFTPDSEYEFTIDGELLYRIKTNHIWMIKTKGS